MNGRQHRAARHEALAVVGLDAGAAAVLDHEPRHLPVAEDGRSPLLEEARERLGERPGPATRDRPAAPLPAEDDRVGVDSRARGVQRHQRLERLPDHERAHVALLELAPNHLPGRDRVAPQPDPPAWMLEQQLLERGPEPGRCDSCATEDPLDLVVLRDQAPVRGGVPPREVADLVAGAIEVEPHRQLLAVRKCDVADRIGLQVLEPVVGVEAQLVIHEQRVQADDRVPGRARVDPVAGPEQLLRRRAAARYGARVQDEALVAGARQVCRGDQAVVARSRDDDVGGLGHVGVSSLRAGSSPSRRSPLPPKIASSTSGGRPSARTVSTCLASPMSNG